MKQFIFKGRIRIRAYGECDDALFVGDSEYPLSYDIDSGINVSVRYWITDTERSKDEILENHIKHISGSIESEFENCYSEMTGYLWTKEHLVIGGHDLLDELSSNVGKYLHLEIDLHE